MKNFLLLHGFFLLFITNLAAQNVGIGTTNPLEKLHISNGQLRLSRTASFENNILFNMPVSQLAGEHEGLKFSLAGTDKAFIGYTSTSTSGNFLRLSGANINANDLVIDAAGNVGIGTNQPQQKLHVSGDVLMNTVNPTLQLQNSGVSKGFLQLSGDNLRIGTNSGNATGKFIIRNNGSDRVFIDEDGRTGIGVVDPGARLHVNSGNSIEALRLEGSGNTVIRMMTSGTDKANIYAAGNDLTIATVQDNGILRLNGEVFINNTASKTGIGTAAPDERLHVNGNVKVSTGKVLNNDNFNLLPLAYARFSSTGSRLSGTSNITASTGSEGGEKHYVITVAGVDLSNAVAFVTYGWNTIGGRVVSVDTDTNNSQKLRVRISNVDNDSDYVPFHIVIFKPF